jgi:hypothetical protein
LKVSYSYCSTAIVLMTICKNVVWDKSDRATRGPPASLMKFSLA